MGANSKKRTTMAKLNREQRLRERRAEKDARKERRKLEPPVEYDNPTVYERPLAELVEDEEK